MEAAAKSASWKMELEAGFQYEAARKYVRCRLLFLTELCFLGEEAVALPRGVTWSTVFVQAQRYKTFFKLHNLGCSQTQICGIWDTFQVPC